MLHQGAADILARVTRTLPGDLAVRMRRAELLSLSGSGKSDAIKEYKEVLLRGKQLSAEVKIEMRSKIKVLESELAALAKPRVGLQSERKLANQSEEGK
jgi:hypothetical protein